MGYKRIDKELKEKIVTEAIKRNEVSSVAREYGVHPSSIHKWRRFGVEGKRNMYTEDFCMNVVRENIISKKSVEECAYIYGVPTYLVVFWAKKYREQIKTETRQRKKKVIRKHRFVHITSHSGYWR